MWTWILGLIGGIAGVGVILKLLLDRLITPAVINVWTGKLEKIKQAFGLLGKTWGYNSGVGITLWWQKWVFRAIWEVAFEPYLILFLQIIVIPLVSALNYFLLEFCTWFVDGLKSDNQTFKTSNDAKNIKTTYHSTF